MGVSLAAQEPKDTYPHLLKVGGGLTGSLKTVEGGDGVESPLKLSTTAVELGGVAFTVPSAARTALGLGTLATQSGTFSGTSSGTNTGDQFTSTAASRLLGRGGSGGSGAAQEITLGAGLSMSGTTLAVDAPNALEFKGNLDCSANPNYPVGAVGDTYYVNVAGKVGGASGTTVEVGDAVLCKADNAGGTEASVGASWCVLQKNLNVAAVALSGLASDLSGGPLRLSDGSASAPTYSFSGATGTGVYRDSTSLGLSVAGSRRMRLTTADQVFFGADEGDRPSLGPDNLLSDCLVTYRVSNHTAFTGDANNAVINSYNGSLFIHRTATAADEFLFFQGRLTVNGGSPATGQVDVNVGAASRTGVIVTQHATPGSYVQYRTSGNTTVGGVTAGTAPFSTPVTPAQITADQDNYAPEAGWTYRLSTDASRTLTGLSISQLSGQRVKIINAGSNNLVLAHQSASSTAANRFLCKAGADITLAADEEADGEYDATASRWRISKR